MTTRAKALALTSSDASTTYVDGRVNSSTNNSVKDSSTSTNLTQNFVATDPTVQLVILLALGVLIGGFLVNWYNQVALQHHQHQLEHQQHLLEKQQHLFEHKIEQLKHEQHHLLEKQQHFFEHKIEQLKHQQHELLQHKIQQIERQIDQLEAAMLRNIDKFQYQIDRADANRNNQ